MRPVRPTRCADVPRARPVPSGMLTWRMPATDRPWPYRRRLLDRRSEPTHVTFRWMPRGRAGVDGDRARGRRRGRLRRRRRRRDRHGGSALAALDPVAPSVDEGSPTVKAEVRQHPRLRMLLQRHIDPAAATGLAVSVSLAVIAVLGLGHRLPVGDGADPLRAGQVGPLVRSLGRGQRHRHLHQGDAGHQPPGRHGGCPGDRRRCRRGRVPTAPQPGAPGPAAAHGGRPVRDREHREADREPRSSGDQPADRVLGLVLPVGSRRGRRGHLRGHRAARGSGPAPRRAQRHRRCRRRRSPCSWRGAG